MLKYREYEEDEKQLQERLEFETSHTYKVGDKVLLIVTKEPMEVIHSTNFINGNAVESYKRLSSALDSVYEGLVGEVVRTSTTPSTGPCIRVSLGGMELNILYPNEQLLPANEITELLYV